MNLRQLTVYEHFGKVNMRTRPITFLFVDQSSSRRLEQVGEDTPTSPDVIEAYTLNYRQKFKFLQLNFFRGPLFPLGGALGSLGQTLTRLKIWRGSTP